MMMPLNFGEFLFFKNSTSQAVGRDSWIIYIHLRKLRSKIHFSRTIYNNFDIRRFWSLFQLTFQIIIGHITEKMIPRKIVIRIFPSRKFQIPAAWSYICFFIEILMNSRIKLEILENYTKFDVSYVSPVALKVG